jgi:predicted GH43/DUF377 family glycosyl hydrolase
MVQNTDWIRYEKNPVFPAIPGTWMESQTANPDILLFEDKYFMYFRGQQNGHDRIGVATVAHSLFDGKTWNVNPEPVLDAGDSRDWDETHVLDPAAVLVNGRIFIYYSAVSPHCDRSVCLAVSSDGVHFKKFKDNPVVIGGGPEIVYHNDLFYLYYWKQRSGEKGFELHLSTSADGYRFDEYSDKPILPVGTMGSWDSVTVETPRIFKEDNVFYMMYCGSDRYEDYPWHAGLAYSHDLVCWEKYAGNPIFSRGPDGAWDEGAIWFTTVEKINGIYFMWYEGYGGGTARTEAYGTYLEGGKSQIGLATLKADYFYVDPLKLK